MSESPANKPITAPPQPAVSANAPEPTGSPANKPITAPPQPAVSANAPEPMDSKVFWSLQKGRSLRALNYVCIYLFVLIVYGGALLTDYLLFQFMWLLLGDDVAQYPMIKTALDLAKIGLALLFIVSAITHGCFSAYSQLRLDRELLDEDRKQ